MDLTRKGLLEWQVFWTQLDLVLSLQKNLMFLLRVNAYVLGGHGDTMVPVIGATNVGGVPVENMIEKNKLASIVQRTRDGWS